MSVELYHCAVYGYRFDGRVPWDKISREKGHEEFDRLYTYSDTDATPGDFIFFQDPRGGRYAIAGILHFIIDSTRRNGPQQIDVTVMDTPDSTLIEAMEQTIDEDFTDYIERKTQTPQHIAFTHNM